MLTILKMNFDDNNLVKKVTPLLDTVIKDSSIISELCEGIIESGLSLLGLEKEE